VVVVLYLLLYLLLHYLVLDLVGVQPVVLLSTTDYSGTCSSRSSQHESSLESRELTRGYGVGLSMLHSFFFSFLWVKCPALVDKGPSQRLQGKAEHVHNEALYSHDRCPTFISFFFHCNMLQPFWLRGIHESISTPPIPGPCCMFVVTSLHEISYPEVWVTHPTCPFIIHSGCAYCVFG
jgi:hypothetical protein